MKFTVTIIGTYEVPEDELDAMYGTTNPIDCAKMDEQCAATQLLEFCDHVEMHVMADGLVIHHTCDDPACTDISHLELRTS